MTTISELAAALARRLAERRLIDAAPSAFEATTGALAPIDAALGDEEARLLETLGVRAVAIDAPDNELTVFLTRKPKRAELARLPREIAGVAVEYLSELLSPVQPLRLAPASRQATPGAAGPVGCGASISLGNDRSAGTMGALVRDRGTGRLYGMTCNHVTGGCNNTPLGMPVVSPAVLDVTAQTERIVMIGRHARVLPLRQGQAHVVTDPNTDVALFDILDESLVTSRQGDRYDTPVDLADPDLGLAVQKLGRTTGHTTGVLRDAVETDLLVPYKHTTHLTPETAVTFQGVCYFADVKVVRGDTPNFAKAGDSGSLVVTVPRPGAAMKAVGLLVGAGRTGYGYILPLKPILDRLDVDLVGGL